MLEHYINLKNLEKSFGSYEMSKPFNHCVVDDFFLKDVALELEDEFPGYNENIWQEYSNALEEKKLTNNWNHFKPLTYKVVSTLNSVIFCDLLSKLSNIKHLHSDDGLNGGGWHIHKSGGKLNPHLDYSIHPKLGLQRKLNVIVYLNSQWEDDWGGELGFWSQNNETKGPGNLVKSIKPLFNRAVIFDTSQNSWHGIIGSLKLPNEQYRRSLALYYLTEASSTSAKRGKALFAPTKDQIGDKNIEELIKKRSSVSEASTVYQKDSK